MNHAMNKLFLLLPIICKDKTCIHPYLKVYSPDSAEELLPFIHHLIEALSIIDHEQYEGYYDGRIFKPLYRFVIEKLGKDAALLLMEELNDWEDFHQGEKYVPTHINVNGIEVKDDLLAACTTCGTEDSFVGSSLTLATSPKATRIQDGQGKSAAFPYLECKKKAMYEWFVEHRSPQRVLDKNYKKHSIFSKEGKRGVISPLTYNYKEASAFLRRAVSGKGESKRLCLWLKEEHKILIFFNERLLQSPTYHAYEINDDQECEINKLSASTRKKMKLVAGL